jgi:transposase InsO family protein
VELATLALGLLLKAAAALLGLLRCCSQGVDWFNHRRLIQPIGNVPPVDAEAAFYNALEKKPLAA